MTDKIPNELYKQILENMPICCVDIVVSHEGKVLLIHRKEEPAKDKWWVVGGRILKGEKLVDAVKRKVREETGLNVEIKKRVGTYELIFERENSLDARKGTHAIAIVYLVKLLEGQSIKLDETSLNYRWIDNIEEDLDDYIKKVLKDSGVFN